MAPNCRQEAKDSFAKGVCFGAVMAIFNLANLYQADAKFCPPPKADVGTAIKLVLTYLEARPDMQDAPFEALALIVMHLTWPCPGTEPKP